MTKRKWPCFAYFCVRNKYEWSGNPREQNKRLNEIQVANWVRATRRALKTPLKASLRLPSDIFCQSGHSLCRICQRTRTCPAGQKIRVIVRFLSTCYVFSTGTRHFLHGKPRPSAAVTRFEQRSKTFPAFPTPRPSFFFFLSFRFFSSRRKFKILFRSQFAWIRWTRRNLVFRVSLEVEFTTSKT